MLGVFVQLRSELLRILNLEISVAHLRIVQIFRYFTKLFICCTELLMGIPLAMNMARGITNGIGKNVSRRLIGNNFYLCQ